MHPTNEDNVSKYPSLFDTQQHRVPPGLRLVPLTKSPPTRAPTTVSTLRGDVFKTVLSTPSMSRADHTQNLPRQVPSDCLTLGV